MLFWLAASYATGMAVALRNFHCLEVVEGVAKRFPVENKGGCRSSTVPLLYYTVMEISPRKRLGGALF